ncbi:MAG: protein kinase [Planctomycetes bacterium]|nr:protein kinase [Planctomycetota bacterium]
MSQASNQPASERASRLAGLLADVARRRQAGEAVDDAALVAAHPDLMPELAEQLRALGLVGQAMARAQAGPADVTIDSAAQAETRFSPSGGSTLETPAPQDELAHGESIPGYEILREIHRGGQGVVYQAIQKSTKRKVAIKVMREGPFAGSSDKARFEREVQILGQLQHPNIVGVHDSGSAAGNFYFVMDYIPGQPLDVYMAGATERHGGTKARRHEGEDRPPVPDAGEHRRPAGEKPGPEHPEPADASGKPGAEGSRGRAAKSAAPGLSIESTLKLFVKICEAVNAAHLRGIIHRDLKPGNIRVDPTGEPHILDFGLAKVAAFDPIGAGGAAVMTMTGQFIGSLPWASPEQAEGQPSKIDVRTDVYSLGVILYQMLTGKFPYEVVGNMRDVLDRILRAEPAKPSTIRRQINDEVETIVLKCLSKERDRRYQTAGELARDVQHYLNGEPIEAKRDSGWYLLKKTIARHRVPAAAIGLVAAVTLVAGVALAVMYRQQVRLREAADDARGTAERERDHARLESAKYKAIDEFLHTVLASANAEAGEKDLRVVDLLDTCSRELPGGFKDQPQIEAAVRTSIGLSYRALGRFAEAERELQPALLLRSTALGAAHADTIEAMLNLAVLQHDRGDWKGAVVAFEDLLRRASGVLDPAYERLITARSSLAYSLQRLRRFDEAYACYQECMAHVRLDVPIVKQSHIRAANNFSSFLVTRRIFDEAGKLLDELEPAAERSLRESDPLRRVILTNRAGLCLRIGELEKCEAALRKAGELTAKVYPEEHPDRLADGDELARVLAERGKLTEAEALLDRVVGLYAKLGRAAPYDVLLAETDRAAVQIQLGKLDSAAASLPALVERCRDALGENSTLALKASFEYGNLLLAQGKADLAEELARQTLERRQQETVYGLRHAETLRSIHQLARALAAASKWPAAELRFAEAARLADQVLPAGHYMAAIFRTDWGISLSHLDRAADAEREIGTAATALEKAVGADHPQTIRAQSAWADALDRIGQQEAARRLRDGLHRAATQGAPPPNK